MPPDHLIDTFFKLLNLTQLSFFFGVYLTRHVMLDFGPNTVMFVVVRGQFFGVIETEGEVTVLIVTNGVEVSATGRRLFTIAERLLVQLYLLFIQLVEERLIRELFKLGDIILEV